MFAGAVRVQCAMRGVRHLLRAAPWASGLLFATLSFGTAQADAMWPTLAAVEGSLRDAGPRATLALHFNCARHQGSGYEAIAQGSAQWVALAERLMRHADACYAEGLQGALGLAMQRAPRQVLPLVGRSATLSAELICLPFVSDEIAPAAQAAAVARSRRAIAAVRDEALRPQQQACLAFIGTVESGIASRQPVPAAAASSAPATAPATARPVAPGTQPLSKP